MLSKKMAFSLMSLIVLLAFAIVAPTAMGDVLGKDFATTISLNHTTTGDPPLIGHNVVATGTISLKVVFGKEVVVGVNPTDPTMNGPGFNPNDVTINAFNKTTGASVTPTVGTPTAAFTGSMTEFTVDLGSIDADTTVLVTIDGDRVTNNNPADVIKAGQSAGADTLGTNKKATLKFEVVAALDTTLTNRGPATVSIMDLPGIALGPGTHDAFSFKVTLSEKPKEFKKDHIELTNATIDSDPIALPAMTDATSSTEASGRVYPYLVTIMPKYESKDDIVIKIKSFENTETPALKSVVSMAYMVKVNSDANKLVGSQGQYNALPKDIIIPANGYLVVAKDTAKSYIDGPGDAKHGSADIARRSEAKHQTYNLIGLGFRDLEGFLIRGGTIDLESPKAGLVITEIMWATDGGSSDRQWIEIKNISGADIKIAETKSNRGADYTNGTQLVFYEAGATIPAVSGRIVDRVSTLYKGTNHWSIAGKGQPGRTDEVIKETIEDGNDVDIDIEVVQTSALISMERVMVADGTYADGTMADSWAQSNLPARNFTNAAGGFFVGSPGADPINPVADPPPVVEETAPVIPVAGPMDIMITEIMVDTGSGRLPQWIELTNVSGAEKSLAGWSLMISNAAADANVIGATVNINLSGTLGVGGGEGMGGTMGKSLLLVGGSARSSSNLAGSDRVIDISTQVGERGRYAFISSMGFMAALIPPQMTGVLTYGDTAGNLGENWELPTDDAGRSSLIRREMDAAGMMTKGTDADGWVLASETPLVSGQTTWYGSDEDEGTPGYDAGGPLPVELSHFRPARDKQTGAVVITWSTQSELNNAGFFIKRSNQRDGEFQVINATMVPGAGTTSEKQTYTYTDTTAQPNIVYYYQIEDVSLDGNRQTLTHGIRLKGHIGAAGKLTSTWGELKSSNE